MLQYFFSSVKVTPDGMDSLIALSQGDMRRALNVLQVSMSNTPTHYRCAQFDSATCMYMSG